VGKKVLRLAPEALKYLENYDWPGNVRELENAVERALALETSEVISVETLPEKVTHLPQQLDGAVFRIPDRGIDLEGHLEQIRKEALIEALRKCNGVQKEAAKMVRMSFRSFRYYAKKYKLTKAIALQ
jgi:two-component system response regulator PilR (NtrC family)